jgi:hypothetical protein
VQGSGKVEGNRLESDGSKSYESAMSTATEEIIQVCEALPPEKQLEVIDFARFLLARQDDERWERLVADPQARPKLEAFLRESAAEADEPLDLRRL